MINNLFKHFVIFQGIRDFIKSVLIPVDFEDLITIDNTDNN